MDKKFLETIYKKHQKTEAVPSTFEISDWAVKLIRLLFPEQSKTSFGGLDEVEGEFWIMSSELKFILEATDQCKGQGIEEKIKKFNEAIPELFEVLNTDVKAIFEGDPAAISEFEVIRAYPGFFAISIYRLAHLLHTLDVKLIPRILTEYAHSETGIDIHPAAVIGKSFFIDHGTGLVIGGTCRIGENVKMYQGVTLGALSVNKELKDKKRHPTVEDNVIIYAGATILGGETVIGANSIIGGNVWITKSIPANSTVYNVPEIKVISN
ncbi:MAG: serine O-acetyltransferase EpsC [Leadbetterella sp.]